MEYVVNIVVICLIVYFLHKRYHNSGITQYFFPALAIKLLAGIGVGLLYFYYYGYGDTIAYHNEAVRLSNIAYDNFANYAKVLFEISNDIDVSQFDFYNQPRAFFFVKILSGVHLLTGQNYWISCIYFSLFSFAGFWIFATSVVKYFPTIKLGVLLALLFFPSIVFWSSGIIKESITMGAMMLLTKVLLEWLRVRKLKWSIILFATFTLWLIWNLKYYYLGIFLAVSIPLIATDLLQKYEGFKSNLYITYSIIFIVFSGLITLIHPNFNLSRILSVIVDNHDLYVLKSQSGQFIQFFSLEPTVVSLVLNFPVAVWSGLFRIGIWEANHVFEYALAIENLILLIFTSATIFQLIKEKNKTISLLPLAAVMYVVLLAAFLALSSPNFGTLARYRVGYLPFMIILITCHNPLLTFFQIKFRR